MLLLLQSKVMEGAVHAMYSAMMRDIVKIVGPRVVALKLCSLPNPRRGLSMFCPAGLLKKHI